MPIRLGFILGMNAAYLAAVWLLIQADRLGWPPVSVLAPALVLAGLLPSTYLARRSGERWVVSTFAHAAAGCLLPAFLAAEGMWNPVRFPNSCSHCFRTLDAEGMLRAVLITFLFALGLALATLPIGFLARLCFGTVDPDPVLPPLFPGPRAR